MKTSVSFYDFKNAFERCGRKDQFTPEGLSTLFDFLEEYEESTGEEIELDVIALCCEYEETDYRDVADSYGIVLEPNPDDDEEITQENIETVREYLNDHTLYVGESSDGVFLFQSF